MAHRASWTGVLSFGMVSLPVGIAPAASRKDVAFKTLAPNGEPIKQLFVDTEGTVIDRSDTTKGYEYAKGQYLPVEQGELDNFAHQSGKDIKLTGFISNDELPLGVTERTYLLFPHGGGNRDTSAARRAALAQPYALVAKALAESDRSGVGFIVLSSKKYPVLVRSDGDDLYLDLLFWRDEVREHDNLRVEVSDDEVKMAVMLIDAMACDFELHNNDTREALIDYLDAKAAGHNPTITEAPAEPAPVVNMMDALKASMAAIESEPEAA